MIRCMAAYSYVLSQLNKPWTNHEIKFVDTHPDTFSMAMAT